MYIFKKNYFSQCNNFHVTSKNTALDILRNNFVEETNSAFYSVCFHCFSASTTKYRDVNSIKLRNFVTLTDLGRLFFTFNAAVWSLRVSRGKKFSRFSKKDISVDR